MTDQNDVRRIALGLPEVVESTDRFAFSVRNRDRLKAFAWVWLERTAPKQPRVPRPDVLAVRVANLQEKDLLISMQPAKYFTEPHYNGFPAVLVRLAVVEVAELEALITDGWKCQAPKSLVKQREREDPADR